jgi:CBS domain-containing protein
MDPERTVADAVAVMAEHHVGAIPVLRDGALIGIFSERDLLRRVVAPGLSPEKTLLREVMTADPVTASARDPREVAIQKMQAVGCRHLPIVADGVIIDMLSMRDLLAVEIEEREAEIVALKQYIRGSG